MNFIHFVNSICKNDMWNYMHCLFCFIFYCLTAHFCLFALYSCILSALCPSLHTTLPNPPLSFSLTEEQPSRIYPSEIKRGKGKKKAKRIWGKIAHPSVNPCTGTQVNRLPSFKQYTFNFCTQHWQKRSTYLKWKRENEMLLVRKENVHLLHFQHFPPPHSSESIFCWVHISIVKHKHTNKY